jgi:ribosome modulation factor
MNEYLMSLDWVERAFVEGIQAFKNDLNERDCPYTSPSSVLREAWIKGYDDAETNHEEQVTCRLLGFEPPDEVTNFIVKHGL